MGEPEMSRDGERDAGILNGSYSLLEKQKLLDSSEGSSSEIKDEEIEASSAAYCRICLEYGGEPGDDLAETHPHKMGAHKGVCGGGPPWMLHTTKAGPEHEERLRLLKLL